MKLNLLLAVFPLFFSCGRSTPEKIQPGPAGIGKVIKPAQVANEKAGCNGKIVRFNTRYHFDSYKAQVLSGKLADPDFSHNEFARDTEYVKFIKEGCKRNGVNFGGHLTIVERSCGAMCQHIFVVDRWDGRVFKYTKPNEGRYGYQFRKDSKLLIANTGSFQDDSMKYYCDEFGSPELYVWKDNDFQRLP